MTSESATERFAALLARPEPEIELDVAALLIAAHAHPGLDVSSWRSRLDDLASAVAAGDADALATHLFVELGFAGNTVDYADPRNSFLDDVLTRRLGIPISLSVLMIEVGRRAAVFLDGVGMPGHFLVRVRSTDVFYDPFHRGTRLDAAACRHRFEALHGPNTGFDATFLDPVGPRAIVRRVLANLERSYGPRDPGSTMWVTRLALLVPGTPPAERRHLATRLGSLGAFAEAATELEALAADLSDDRAREAEAAARALRARAN